MEITGATQFLEVLFLEHSKIFQENTEVRSLARVILILGELCT